MNRLNTFLSISALSLASSVSVAVADNKGFESNKIDSVSSRVIENQENTVNKTDAKENQEIIKK